MEATRPDRADSSSDPGPELGCGHPANDGADPAGAELHERLRQAELTAAIGIALTSSDALARQLQRCVQALVTYLDAAFARIWTLNEAEQMLELQASAGLYTHLDGFHGRIAVGAYKIGRIAQLKLPHLTNSVPLDPQVSDKEWATREGMAAFAGYPLLIGDRVVGVMGLFARHTLTAATVQAMATVADSIALGIARARATDEAMAERDLLRQVLDVLPEGVVIADAQARLVLTNSAARAILGTSEVHAAPAADAGEATKRYHSRRLDGTPYETREGLLYRSILGGEVVRSEQLLVRYGGEGRDVPLLANSAPLRDADDTITGGVMVFQDISAIKDLERQKDAFLAAISHDLKNPLTALLALSQLLRRRVAHLPESEQRRFADGLDTITQSARQMSAQLGELLDVVRLQMARPLDLERRSMDLVALVTRIVQRYQLTTDRHTLSCRHASEELYCLGDEIRLDRVLANLLSNAIKYSPQGGHISVTIERPADEWAEIHIADQGIGIPPEDQPHVFEYFYRGSNVNAGMTGTGIGLAGARLIVEQHGGSVDLVSAPGLGATMTIRLPVHGPAHD